MKNGVEEKHASFTPWFWSYRWAARLEGALVVCVFAGVLFIMGYLFQMPGALVVHLQDDRHDPVKNARVRCTAPSGGQSFAGLTDVFGEAKWPGLDKGAWRCEVTPPDSFHAGVVTGFATVAARHPAVWVATVERPGRIAVQVVRPDGAARAKVAVRAACEGGAWEARAGLLDGRALLFVPHGASCRVGLVRPELPFDGTPTQTALDCENEPCSAVVSAGVGQSASVVLKPTREQWEAVRPPPEPDQKP